MGAGIRTTSLWRMTTRINSPSAMVWLVHCILACAMGTLESIVKGIFRTANKPAAALPSSIPVRIPTSHTPMRTECNHLVTSWIPVLPFIAARVGSAHLGGFAPGALDLGRSHADLDGFLNHEGAQLGTVVGDAPSIIGQRGDRKQHQ